MIDILFAAFALLGLFFTLLGIFVMFHILRPQHSPADTSNRINKIRLFWFVLTREELFVGIFPWLKNDELENLRTPRANYRGNLDNVLDLPLTNNTFGDVFQVGPSLFVWSGEGWGLLEVEPTPVISVPLDLAIPGPQGPTGLKGEEGPKGPEGMSAYEAAVKGGYKGTLEDFYASLGALK